jgi:hypothetical protein
LNKSNKSCEVDMKRFFVLMLFFTGLGAAFTQTMEARFIEVRGTVEIKDANSPGWSRAVPGGVIGRNTVISTGLKSGAVLSLGSSRLDVRSLTMLTLEELAQRGGAEQTTVYLRTGRVRADVTPPTGRSVDFTVGSPTVTASVRGTSFEFDGRRLRVENGRVLLTGSGGQKVYVAQAQRSYVDENNQNRIVPPFEAQAALLRPVIPELSGAPRPPDLGVSPAPGTPPPPPPDNKGTGTGITIDWP